MPLISAACDEKFCRKAPVQKCFVNGRIFRVLRDYNMSIVPEQFIGQLKTWALADGTMRIILVAGQLITKSFFPEL